MSDNDLNHVPDAELVAQAKRGETQAFGQLYERYVEQIYRYVKTRVTRDQDAEDLTENVFVRSYEALDSYQERGWPYSAFLYQVARNLLVDHYRQDKGPQLVELDEPLPTPDPTMEQLLLQSDFAQEAMAAVGGLPEDYQEIIRLRILMGMSTKRAAEWMDRSEGATRVLLHRALKALREQLD